MHRLKMIYKRKSNKQIFCPKCFKNISDTSRDESLRLNNIEWSGRNLQ